MKTFILAFLVAVGLTGCVVVPAGYGGPPRAYVSPPSVFVVPGRSYYAPGYRYDRGYGYGHSHYRPYY